MKFWNVKKPGGRWTAYEMSGKPKVPKGYLVTGPHKNIVQAFAAAVMANKGAGK